MEPTRAIGSTRPSARSASMSAFQGQRPTSQALNQPQARTLLDHVVNVECAVHCRLRHFDRGPQCCRPRARRAPPVLQAGGRETMPAPFQPAQTGKASLEVLLLNPCGDEKAPR